MPSRAKIAARKQVVALRACLKTGVVKHLPEFLLAFVVGFAEADHICRGFYPTFGALRSSSLAAFAALATPLQYSRAFSA